MMKEWLEWVFLGKGYLLAGVMALLCITGPLMVKDTKDRFRRGVNTEDENTVYTETAVIAVLLALVWPVVIGVLVVIYILKSMAATMKAAVKLSSKE